MTAIAGIALALGLGSYAGEDLYVVTDLDRCAELDADELTRALRAEVCDVDARRCDGTTVAFSLRCDGADVHVEAVDMGRWLAARRTLPRPPATDPTPEQTLALALSSMLLAQWVPVESRPRPDPRPPPAEAVSPPVAAPMRVSPPPSRPVRPRRDAIVIELEPRVFLDARRPQVVPSLALGYGAWLHERIGLLGLVGVRYGQTERTLGTISLRAVSLGGRGTWRTRATQSLRLGGDVGADLVYVAIAGKDSIAVDGRRLDGWAATFSTAFGPSYRAGLVEATLLARLGYSAAGPVGNIPGDHPATLRGLWLGLGLRVSVTPGRKRRRDRRELCGPLRRPNPHPKAEGLASCGVKTSDATQDET